MPATTADARFLRRVLFVLVTATLVAGGITAYAASELGTSVTAPRR